MTAQPEAPASAPAPEDGTPAPETPQQPSTTPETPEQPQAGGTWNPDAWDGKVESLPAEARRIIDDARSEAGKARTTAKQQAADEARAELAQSIGKALGLVTDDDTPADPAELTKQLTEQGEAHQNLQREHQVLRSAISAGADHEALLDSRSFLAKVANLDPAAEDFPSKVDDAIKQAIADNPKLKASQAPATSGVDHPGGSGEGDVTSEQFKSMTGAERNALARTNPTLYNRLAGRS